MERTVNLKLRFVQVFAATVALSLAACVDEDNPVIVTPDAAFVGYSDPATKQTVCGNCHVSKQREWVTTRHASAWASVADRDNASTACASCHTTNGTSSGDSTDDGAGYFAVDANSKPLYYDVQCESCHGPGSAHVTAPDDTQPIVGVTADTGMTSSCGTCHTGTHNPFIDEWRSSRHGRVDSHANTNVACRPCHDARAWLATYAPDAKFTEQANGTAPADWVPTTCATCHDPHGSDNRADLRLSTDALDDNNLCITCHHKRGEPDLTTYRGPHSPQGPMVLGTAGWRPSGFTWDSTMGTTHANPTANPGLCGNCHVSGFSRTDATTSTTVYTTGHTFDPIPCLNAGGAPDYTIADCEVGARSFQACATSGCHSSEASARAALTAAEGRFDFYARIMWIDVDADGRVDAFPTDSGMAAIARRDFPADFPTRSATNAPPLSAGEGLAFNARLLWMPGQAAHNGFYGEALAIATINAARTRYGLAVPPALLAQLQSRAAALGVRNIR